MLDEFMANFGGNVGIAKYEGGGPSMRFGFIFSNIEDVIQSRVGFDITAPAIMPLTTRFVYLASTIHYEDDGVDLDLRSKIKNSIIMILGALGNLDDALKRMSLMRALGDLEKYVQELPKSPESILQKGAVVSFVQDLAKDHLSKMRKDDYQKYLALLDGLSHIDLRKLESLYKDDPSYKEWQGFSLMFRARGVDRFFKFSGSKDQTLFERSFKVVLGGRAFLLWGMLNQIQRSVWREGVRSIQLMSSSQNSVVYKKPSGAMILGATQKFIISLEHVMRGAWSLKKFSDATQDFLVLLHHTVLRKERGGGRGVDVMNKAILIVMDRIKRTDPKLYWHILDFIIYLGPSQSWNRYEVGQKPSKAYGFVDQSGILMSYLSVIGEVPYMKAFMMRLIMYRTRILKERITSSLYVGSKKIQPNQIKENRLSLVGQKKGGQDKSYRNLIYYFLQDKDIYNDARVIADIRKYNFEGGFYNRDIFLEIRNYFKSYHAGFQLQISNFLEIDTFDTFDIFGQDKVFDQINERLSLEVGSDIERDKHFFYRIMYMSYLLNKTLGGAEIKFLQKHKVKLKGIPQFKLDVDFLSGGRVKFTALKMQKIDFVTKRKSEEGWEMVLKEKPFQSSVSFIVNFKALFAGADVSIVMKNVSAVRLEAGFNVLETELSQMSVHMKNVIREE